MNIEKGKLYIGAGGVIVEAITRDEQGSFEGIVITPVSGYYKGMHHTRWNAEKFKPYEQTILQTRVCSMCLKEDVSTITMIVKQLNKDITICSCCKDEINSKF